MKHFLTFFVLCLLLLVGCDQNTSNQKQFKIPQLTGRVVDQTNILSNDDKRSIEQQIVEFEKNTGGQFVVCIVPSLGDLSIEQASIKIVDQWKIGHKDKDNGLLLLWCPNNREFRIEVGYGFEGQLNDGKLGEVKRSAIKFFKDEKYVDGINLIITNCTNLITGKVDQQTLKSQNDKYESEHKETSMWMIIIVVVIFGILFVVDPQLAIMLLYVVASGGKGGSSFSGRGGRFGGGGVSGKY